MCLDGEKNDRVAFQARADYQNHAIGWLHRGYSSLGGGKVVRFPRIWVVYGECRLTDLQHPWRRFRARAGLDDVRIHDLSHTFASRALALGESLTMIGKLLGHTQVQTTARYAHLARDSMQTAASCITESIGGNLLDPGDANSSRK